ncbi:MAG: hypothetical protein IJC18_01235 [Clostridia bacterium]|nr:hypothetical protein [Clostridia bacterium]
MKKVRHIKARVARNRRLTAHVKPVVQLKVNARKTLFTRTNLPDGDFLMNYYFRENEAGDLVPEDIELATHFERVVYDRYGNVIGSTIGRLGGNIHW